MPGNIRKPRLRRSAATSAGSVPSSCPTALADVLREHGPGPDQQPDRGSGRRLDHRGPGCPQDPDRRSARRRPQPQAGSITFPAGTTRQQAEPIVARFARGRAERRRLRRRREASPPSSTAKSCRATRSRLRDLPPALQEMMLPMQVGQATQPFGSIEEGVRMLVICGRDEADPTAPTLRPGLQPDERRAREPPRPPLPARPAPRCGDRIPLIANSLGGGR